MIFHALASASGITAQCAPPVAGQSPTWLPVIQATGSIATAVGVLIALYIAVIRDPRSARSLRGAPASCGADGGHPARQGRALRSASTETGADVCQNADARGFVVDRQSRQLRPCCSDRPWH